MTKRLEKSVSGLNAISNSRRKFLSGFNPSDIALRCVAAATAARLSAVTRKRLPTPCFPTLVNEITLNLPVSKGREEEPVDSFSLGTSVVIRHFRSPLCRRFARPVPSAFRFRRLPASAPSCCSHQYPPLMNPFLFVCSHHGVGAVAQNHTAAPARIFIRIKLPHCSSGFEESS